MNVSPLFILLNIYTLKLLFYEFQLVYNMLCSAQFIYTP